MSICCLVVLLRIRYHIVNSNPDNRPSAKQLLSHKWLEGEPEPVDEGSDDDAGGEVDANGRKKGTFEAHDESDDDNDGKTGGPSSNANVNANANGNGNGNGNTGMGAVSMYNANQRLPSNAVPASVVSPASASGHKSSNSSSSSSSSSSNGGGGNASPMGASDPRTASALANRITSSQIALANAKVGSPPVQPLQALAGSNSIARPSAVSVTKK
jgi:hypothetical protein